MGDVKWSDVKRTAEAELGYTEGSDNWTKYAADLDKINYFNSPKQNVSWCGTYVAWCIWKSSNPDPKGTALAAQYQPTKDNCGCGVKFNADYYKKKNKFFSEAKPGDVFFLKNYSHMGFVLEVYSDGTFKTNEGNHDNKVANVIRKISDMAGFGRPWYTAESSTDKEVNITVKVNAPEGVKVNIKVEKE